MGILKGFVQRIRGQSQFTQRFVFWFFSRFAVVRGGKITVVGSTFQGQFDVFKRAFWSMVAKTLFKKQTFSLFLGGTVLEGAIWFGAIDAIETFWHFVLVVLMQVFAFITVHAQVVYPMPANDGFEPPRTDAGHCLFTKPFLFQICRLILLGQVFFKTEHVWQLKWSTILIYMSPCKPRQYLLVSFVFCLVCGH